MVPNFQRYTNHMSRWSLGWCGKPEFWCNSTWGILHHVSI